eukprot:TRINITY_DN9320_c0_g2_i1.p1 TRINITY_DN9320_c0_g2~~TRINITY_DN9320_c0_g2_i1.p1  ORF type:complete len:565 (+),score=148.36 TRINITY_DN9320_c0_g2_i1:73-1767(+)
MATAGPTLLSHVAAASPVSGVDGVSALVGRCQAGGSSASSSSSSKVPAAAASSRPAGVGRMPVQPTTAAGSAGTGSAVAAAAVASRPVAQLARPSAAKGDTAAAALAAASGSASAAESREDASDETTIPASEHFHGQLPHEATIASSYEKLGAPIGEGTYGTVWRARCTRTGDQVAMKRVVLRNEREGFPVTAVREVRALKRLDHPNVVRLFDVCAAPPAPGSNSPGDIYLIFEYAPSDLTGLLAYRKQKLKLPEIKCLVWALANALDFCHLQNIMHRDLKPSNVLITGQGELKLCDFGLSRIAEGPGNYSTRVITLWYRPPELLLGTRHYDQSVDVWSAGCIFGELLAGYPLFPESTELGVFRKICERCGARPEEAWPEQQRRLPQWEKFFLPPKRGEEPSSGVGTTPGTGDIFVELNYKHGPSASDLIRSCLKLEPKERIAAGGVLEHRFLEQEPLRCKPSEIRINQTQSCHELDIKRQREKMREEKEAQRAAAAAAVAAAAAAANAASTSATANAAAANSGAKRPAPSAAPPGAAAAPSVQASPHPQKRGRPAPGLNSRPL